MDALVLCYDGEPLREFALDGRALEIGSCPGCDIVVHDPEVSERHLLIQARGGTVVVYDLASRRASERSLPCGEPLALGRFHSLVRVAQAARRRDATGATEPLSSERREHGGIAILIGRGVDARRIAIESAPLSIGTADSSDVVLDDRAVSARHCRIEPWEGGARVRDLGSRNGTYVDGVLVSLANVEPGSTIRVGRTDMRLIAREPALAPNDLIARSPVMQDAIAKAARFARLSFPVLISGESGTGKEGLAHMLHAAGPRAKGPFVAVNAGGMPRSLVESELFGHERGSFTGAAAQHRGVFEQADGGTLFLDEIGELPLDLQARLLRVLETWEVRRVGAERSIAVDVRLVCATHRDLPAMVREGELRQDLYFRIAQLVVQVPPLRERPDDVAALADHFVARAAPELGARRLSREAIARLLEYAWPGNARELRNVVQRAIASCAGTVVSSSDIDAAFRDAGVSIDSEAPPSYAHLVKVVDLHRGNLTSAARALGVPRTTLRDRLRAAHKRDCEE
jgi:pSer/pThr/pTyr-binding forkhead associated (FHA) protein